jgi:hypothetical protein
MPDSKRYIPSKEADTNYLKGNMTAGDLSRFVAMMLILQGNSLPPFPDQQ